MSFFTKKGLPLTEGDKVKWDGIQAIVVAVAEEDTECPYRVFSANHETSGWVAGEVLELVESVRYEAPASNLLRVGDFVSTPEGKGVVTEVDEKDPVLPYAVGLFGGDRFFWGTFDEVQFISRPDYGMEVGDAA